MIQTDFSICQPQRPKLASLTRICSLYVFQMQFALVKIKIVRIKHQAQHFVEKIIS